MTAPSEYPEKAAPDQVGRSVSRSPDTKLRRVCGARSAQTVGSIAGIVPLRTLALALQARVVVAVPELHDNSDLFGEAREPRFIGACRVREADNERIAARVMQGVEPLVRTRPDTGRKAGRR